MSIPFWIVFLVFLGYIIWKFLIRRRIVKSISSFPTIPSLPIIGHALYFRGSTDILDVLYQIFLKCGSPYRLTAIWVESLVLVDPKHIEEVLGTTNILQKSQYYNNLGSWLGTGLLTAKPAKWRKTRKIITPTFHFEILENFIEVFNSCADVLVNKLNPYTRESRTDIYEHVTLCTLDVICETAMGTKINAQNNIESKYVKSVKLMSRILRDRIFCVRKMLDVLYYFTSDYRLEKEVVSYLHCYTDSLIQKKRKNSASNGQQNESISGRKTRLAFLDLLLQSNIDGVPMTDEEIRDEVDTFMFEGHDTTATAIIATLYCLAHNCHIQNKAVEELKVIMEDDGARNYTYDDLQNMKYLEMIIKEALRLYPPVPVYGRITDDNLNIVIRESLLTIMLQSMLLLSMMKLISFIGVSTEAASTPSVTVATPMKSNSNSGRNLGDNRRYDAILPETNLLIIHPPIITFQFYLAYFFAICVLLQ